MRQTKTRSEKAAKFCSECGAKTWMWDDVMQKWQGPWHHIDCPSVPGGKELEEANLQAKLKWEQEEWVPREMGARILKAIGRMMDKHNTHEQMMATKEAIQKQLAKL